MLPDLSKNVPLIIIHREKQSAEKTKLILKLLMSKIGKMVHL